jgi:peptidylprolyl isomerase
MGMLLGEKARFTCSPEWCYGDSGFCAWGILPNSNLMWELVRISVNKCE